MPLFSIIIPVYNTAEYFDECLQSILRQDFPNIEIILINDCSTDNCGEIADRYSEQYDFITTLHHDQNLGVSRSRNDGIKIARGKYVLFIDSDDRIFDGCLSGLNTFISGQSDPDVIICRVISQHGEYSNAYMFDDAILATTDPDRYLEHLNKDNFHPECCWHYVINRQFLLAKELFFGDMKIAEDQEFVTRLLCRLSSFSLYTGDYYWYRERDHSLKKSMDLDASVSLLKVADSFCDFFNSQPLSNTKQAFIRLRVRHALGLFSARLVMHEKNEIKQLAQIFSEFEKNSKMLIDGFGRADMASIVTKYGLDNCLTGYHDVVVKETLSLVEQHTHDELYLYCTGLIGKATARILQLNGYRISGVLDDNETLEGLSMMGLNIYSSAILTEKTKEDLSKVFVIVCNQKTMLFERILENLRLKDVRAEQVVHKFF